MSQTFGCPCDAPVPTLPTNAPGLRSIAYRTVTYGQLRRALLTPLPNETQLTAWRPGEESDLAVMIAEWWAYLGDILTFYNERIANEDYLRTATQPTSVRGLVRLLGYRPQPGIGAQATLAAVVQPGQNAGQTVTLPAKMQVQSKPAPGQAPQVFELGAATSITTPDVVLATAQLALLSPNAGILLLDGTVSSIIGGAVLLLRPRNLDNSAPSLVLVSDSKVQTTLGGTKQTQLSVSLPGGTPTGSASAFRLEQTTQTALLWSLGGGNAIDSSGNVHLAGLVRTLNVGDHVVFTYPASGGVSPMLATIAAIQDTIWDGTGNTPGLPSKSNAATALIIPHTQLTIQEPLLFKNGSGVTMLYYWREAAKLVDQPVATWPSASLVLVPATSTPFPISANSTNVLIADAAGTGVPATATTQTGGSLLVAGLPTPQPTLQTPLSVMFNTLQLTRGQTVPAEVLGDGDPTQANQSFQLAKSPLTYLRKDNAVVSTLTITVNQQPWAEVDNFYGQPPDARVFVAVQDESAVTTVLFGDGMNGARLPAGTSNVVATYRTGSGSVVPPAGTLTVIANPIPGLRALRNPLTAGGGSDPDPPDRIRAYAPRSMLTFGRAVSAADFEAIAAGVANGNRVSATWAWDSARQRGAVTIHVAADPTTVNNVEAALAQAGDPNRPINVVTAQPLAVLVAMELLISALVSASDVQTGIVTALTDPAHGVFGAAQLGIGQPVFNSQILAACQAVPGVVAIGTLLFVRADISLEETPLHTPPEGQYFNLDPSLVWVFTQVSPSGG